MTLRDALSMFVARRCDVLPVANQQGEPCGTPISAICGDVPVKRLCDPLLWLIVLFLLLLFGLPYSQPFFAALFPDLPRPVYQQESFAALALAHFWLVGISSLFAVVVGVGAGIAVTRESGKEFRPRWRLSPPSGRPFAGGGTGDRGTRHGFGQQPAIIALILYGVLPILQATGRAGRGACQRDERCQRYGNEPSPTVVSG